MALRNAWINLRIVKTWLSTRRLKNTIWFRKVCWAVPRAKHNMHAVLHRGTCVHRLRAPTALVDHLSSTIICLSNWYKYNIINMQCFQNWQAIRMQTTASLKSSSSEIHGLVVGFSSMTWWHLPGKSKMVRPRPTTWTKHSGETMSPSICHHRQGFFTDPTAFRIAWFPSPPLNFAVLAEFSRPACSKKSSREAQQVFSCWCGSWYLS